MVLAAERSRQHRSGHVQSAARTVAPMTRTAPQSTPARTLLNKVPEVTPCPAPPPAPPPAKQGPGGPAFFLDHQGAAPPGGGPLRRFRGRCGSRPAGDDVGDARRFPRGVGRAFPPPPVRPRRLLAD